MELDVYHVILERLYWLNVLNLFTISQKSVLCASVSLQITLTHKYIDTARMLMKDLVYKLSNHLQLFHDSISPGPKQAYNVWAGGIVHGYFTDKSWTK